MKAKACPMCGAQAQQLGDTSFCLDCDWDDLPVIKSFDSVQAAIDDLVENCGFPESSVPDLKRLLPKYDFLALDTIREIKTLPENTHTILFPKWTYVDGTLRLIEHRLRIREVPNQQAQ